MNKRCQLIVEMENNGKISVHINGTGKDILFATAMLVEVVCEKAKIPTAVFAMTLPMFPSIKKQASLGEIKIDLEAILKEMEREGEKRCEY